ncbi:MAG: hypothetical protein J6R68_02250, partial [Clostridia bacterium]|nr:hypothetical protein [Clostridia bacterium]
MNNVSFGGSNEYGRYFYNADTTTQGPSRPRTQRINQQTKYEAPTYYGAPYEPDSFEKKTQAKK